MKHEQYREQQLDDAIASLPRDIRPERELWTQLEQRLPERGEAATTRGNGSRHRWAAVLVLGLVGLLGWRLLLLPMESDEQQGEDWLAGSGQISQPDNWQRHLAVWDEAIARVRTGLEYYPEEPALLAQLESLYQQQRNYLQLVSATETSYY